MRKLGRSPLLSSSSHASIDEKKQEQSSRIGNTSWFQYGKCYEKETEGESFQDTNQKEPSRSVQENTCAEV